jgi:hypothetical protein
LKAARILPQADLPLNGILETVFERRKSIRSLIEAFWKSARNPFSGELGKLLSDRQPGL